MKKMLLGLLLCFLFIIAATAQVAITTDGSTAGANTMLDIKSSNKGVKFPRLTTAERKAIPVTTADAGLMVFDTDRQVLYMYDGNEWLPFAVSTNPAELIKKKYPSGSPRGNFGYSCAVSGNYAVVGAYVDSVNNVWSPGSAYTYKKINGAWTVQGRVVAADGTKDAQFGWSVAMDGDYMAIGANEALNAGGMETGAVYVFKRNGDNWIQQAKLTAAVPVEKENLGYSVAIEGDVIITGATKSKVGTNIEQGAAYVFIRNGNIWIQQAKLVANDGTAQSYFGAGVAVNNNDIVVGASQAKVGAVKEGAAYVFTRNGNFFTFEKKLVTDNGGQEGLFGVSVSVSNGVIAVGASKETYFSLDRTGTVHVFKRINNLWQHLEVEYPFLDDPEMNFGIRTIIKGDIIMVSAQQENVGDYIDKGSVYIWKWNGAHFEVLKRVIDPEGFTNEHFGTAAGFDGTNFVIGAPNVFRHAGTTDQGMVFFGAIE